MAHVSLKQLRYFDALARERHFGRAAKACAISQPALSMQIHDLEQSLGITLVERTRTGVQLTEKGHEIAMRSARVLNDVRDLVAYAKQSGTVLAGPLTLGVIPSIAPYMLPPLLPILRDTYPQLQLFVRETQTKPLTDELLEGKLDVLLLALPLKHPDIEERPIFEDRFLLAVPRDKRISQRMRATPEMIERERLLLLEEGHCLRDQALSYCDMKQVKMINTFGASCLSTIVEMVSGGLGITLLPEICLGVEMRGRDFTLVRFAEPEPFRTVGLVWRTTSPRKHEFEELARLAGKAWSSGPHASALAALKERRHVSAASS
jgi:LysR family hydrogen peroxide-inducible transcriptional activator